MINKACTFVAPSYVKKLYKCAKNYPAWKAKHNPNWKPWLYPEQIEVAKLNMQDVVNEDVTDDDRIDETQHQTEASSGELKEYLGEENGVSQ